MDCHPPPPHSFRPFLSPIYSYEYLLGVREYGTLFDHPHREREEGHARVHDDVNLLDPAPHSPPFIPRQAAPMTRSNRGVSPPNRYLELCDM